MADNNKEMPKAVEPLFFVIDEKNHSIELTDKGIDILSGTNQDPEFFILPDIAAQLSAVENEDLSDEQKQERKDELLQNYSIKSERVHTVNQLLKAYTLFDINVEYVIDDGKIKIVDEQTGRIMEGRRYSDGLHQAIEAKEGVKVEAATQTYATITLQNYFRMYRKLAGMTGTAMTEAGEFYDIYKLEVVEIPTNRPVIRNDQNDRVYRTKKEKYNAVIDEIQAMIEIGRPVLVGTTSVEISELLSRMLQLRKIPHQVLNAKLHQKEAEIVAHAGEKGMVTIATNMAGRGTDIKLAPEVKEAGGLAIIGTERHESRRVDRQLRGRAGRQGDPGSSVFFVSFEDTVMRLFANERIVKTLDRLGFKEGDMIDSKMVTKSIENAQKRVEENNFGIRKRLVEYDDVMNAQRKGVYGRRQNALKGERVGSDIANMIYETAEEITGRASDFDTLQEETRKVLSLDVPITAEEYPHLDPSDITARIAEAAMADFNRKKEKMAQGAMPYWRLRRAPGRNGPRRSARHRRQASLQHPLRHHRGVQQQLLVAEQVVGEGRAASLHRPRLAGTAPRDGRAAQVRAECQLRAEGPPGNLQARSLRAVEEDALGHEHQVRVDAAPRQARRARLRGGQGPGRSRPRRRRGGPRPGRGRTAPPGTPTRVPAAPASNPYAGYSTTRDDYETNQRKAMQSSYSAQHQQPSRTPIKNAQPKVGRNDPCPCGSGKKYKNCHGKGQ